MLAALLNRFRFQDALDGSPYADIVAEVGEVMLRSDPMGLRGFGVPQNEYYPEAFALTAWIVTGNSSTDDFQTFLIEGCENTPPPRTLTVEEVQNAATEIFTDLFGQAVDIDMKTARRCLDCYHEAQLAQVQSSSKLGSSSSSPTTAEGLPLRNSGGRRMESSSSSDGYSSSGGGGGGARRRLPPARRW